MSSGRIRVLFLSDHLGHPGGLVHGVGTYCLNVLPRMDPALLELTACFLREPHPFSSQLEAAGVQPIFLSRDKWDPRAFGDLIRLIREREIDIVHAAGMKGILLGRAAARKIGCRTVIHVHDTLRPGPLTRWLHRRSGAWTDVALCVSEEACRMVESDLGVPSSRVRLFHNAVALETFAPDDGDARRRIRVEFGIRPEVPVIGVIGRFHRVKGHKLLIGAMSALLKARPEAVLMCVGDGETRRECEKLAAEKQVADSIRFTGQRDDVPSILAAIDVVAMPSIQDGLPFAAIEAMATHTPVVGFEIGGIPEVVSDGETGLLVPAENIDLFVEALLQILGDPGLAGELRAGCARRAKSFSLDAHVDRLQEVYRDVLGAGG